MTNHGQCHVQSGEVELVIRHLPDCGCDLHTPDPDATLVQLGCVTGYLVNRSALGYDLALIPREDA